MKLNNCAEPISFRSSKLRDRPVKRKKCETELKMASALNYTYEHKEGYEKALVDRKIAACERSTNAAVPNRPAE